MSPTKDLPVKRFASRSAWEVWLAKHHETSPGVWLELAKKESGLKSVTRPDALEVALCYGWIDGQAAPVDTKRWRQRFTPRRPRSKWSLINCAAVERLHAKGRLAPAGIRAMESAKRDGRWAAAYASPRTMAVPEDLQAALRRHPRAERAFAQLDSQNRYAILYRLQDAKKAETRQRRLTTFIRMLEAGETLHPRKSGLVVFLRGVNVGGHRTFRPSLLARELRRYDVVNVGAAGTFVVRKPGSQAKFRAALLRKLPFETEAAFCDGRDLLRLETEHPFGTEPPRPDTVRFVSILSKACRVPPSTPITLPSGGEWLLRVIASQDRFVFGEYRRHMKTIGYLGRIDKLFGVPATTRNWNTILAIVRILKG